MIVGMINLRIRAITIDNKSIKAITGVEFFIFWVRRVEMKRENVFLCESSVNPGVSLCVK